MSEDLERTYQKALFYIQKGPKSKTNQKQQLEFYALFKQIEKGGKI